ncbi:carbohydrate esterase family 9 protein [Dendrothele bispora CBS 962.96]|uniref:Carbohydrate esterase family 9 protein n=1 Tax=Dendrothele bispora (strain CBS 962.96) TaxID=1314807 RepID=A0A4S8M1Y6_DENBC|nr:carbohydrate esterase family 9 protein [Dendrothele bispora CBS 962.96]
MEKFTPSTPASSSRTLRLFLALVPTVFFLLSFSDYLFPSFPSTHVIDASLLERCKSLKTPAGPPADFYKRTQSDRYLTGAKPTLIKNAKIWTGEDEGNLVVQGDVLLDKGMIMGVGRVPHHHYKDITVLDAKGGWVTPGIVDLHSHLGVYSSPSLEGSDDGNSLKGTIGAWMRAIDGLNTHDDSYNTSIAGGVTTSLILPGSANAIGGQAYPIKLRRTHERSPSSMLLEPPYQINSSLPVDPSHIPWRHMKHACGENPSRVYSDTRMDTIWAFRDAYNKASQLKKKQDDFCAKVEAGQATGDFPDDLQWESLVDVLRGRVKVNIHCYETVDLDALVRLSNEFQFPIAAFHHSSETYLVPEVLKRAYGHPPSVALFATNARYKREAYRSSEFAPRILAENNLRVVMKSDHSVLNSRYLLYEAQQAHYYGLPQNLAIAAVTSSAAETMGMGHRIGYVKKGWDADLVLWDSHPLALGATPKQVFIDGIPQLETPHASTKPPAFQHVPSVPNFDKEAEDAVTYDGLPPLRPSSTFSETVVFTNVKSVYSRSGDVVEAVYTAQDAITYGTVVVRNGRLICTGTETTCLSSSILDDPEVSYVDLEGGSLSPSLLTFGSPLGLSNIDQEDSTNDGVVLDPLIASVPKIVGGDSALIRAVDGLEFQTRDALLAYRSGVSTAVTAPSHYNFFGGLATSFSTGSAHKLEPGAVIQEGTGLHMSVRHFGTPSVSTQIAALRRLLLEPQEGATGKRVKEVLEGRVPLVIEAHSADIIATLVLLKKEVKTETGKNIRLTITGASEAHLLAKELGEFGVGVILNPARSFPFAWEDRRILPGPPLTEYSPVSKLVSHNVTVGIGVQEIWDARNLRFEIAWASLAANGKIGKEEAIAIGSVNLEKLLGMDAQTEGADMVATRGGDLLEMSSKVAGIISPRRGLVDLF